MTESAVVLRLSGITKRFGALTANDAISLTLARGEVLALLGENGAGKSTLVSILFGHYVADAGSIEAFGLLRKTEDDFRDMRLRAAYLFQDADDQLFCPSVVEDVAFGPLNQGFSEEEAMDKARATLARYRQVAQLSGGKVPSIRPTRPPRPGTYPNISNRHVCTMVYPV